MIALALVGCGNDLGFPRPIAPDAASVAEPGIGAGLPCEVSAILSDHCTGCHGRSLAGGAPIHLTTYDELTATNPAGAMIAQRALDRMRSTTAQMPPTPATAVTATEIAAFQAWVTAGTPLGDGSCGAGPGGGGGGVFDGPVVCTSGSTWTGGNRGSSVMHPGVACIACHAMGGGDDRHGDDDAPRFTVAGTAFPTGHEPDDCNGANGPATGAAVEVTDSGGKVTSLPINAAGNFFSTAAIAFPIHVAVVAGGKRRAMSSSPPVGDCNSCHTRDGANMAPGRIAIP